MDFSISVHADAGPGAITTAYDDRGQGDPIVLIHGHPFDRSMWRPQVDEFAGAGSGSGTGSGSGSGPDSSPGPGPGWRVIAPDLRGYGESSVVPGVTGLDVFASDIAALLDHLKLDRVVLGGLSMGGQIVMEFYRLFPERVRGLLLADTFPRAETPEGKVSRSAMADRVIAEGMAPYANEVLDKMVAPYNVTALPDVAAHVLQMMCATDPQGAAAALRGRAERPDYCELLTQVAVPALVVVGADDEYTPVADAEFMHEQLPQSTLAVIPNAAHLPNLERPAEFNDVLRRFLASIPPTAPHCDGDATAGPTYIE
jgi:pimeloyl-ACP methyl ester carboxylesterase